MKKLLLALSVLVAGVLVAHSWLASQHARQEHRALVQAIAAHPGARVLESGFDGGFESSNAQVVVEIHGRLGERFQEWIEERGGEDVRPRIGLHVTHRIEHGPRMLLEWLQAGPSATPPVARVASVVALDQESQAELAGVIGRLPALEVDTLLRLTGVGESELRMAPVRLATQQGDLRLRSKGIQGSLVFASGGDRLAGTLRSAGLGGRFAGLDLEISGIAWQLDSASDPHGLAVGEWTGSIARLQLGPGAESGEAPVVLERGTLRADSRSEEGLYGASLVASFDELRVDEETWGASELALGLHGVNAPALAAWQRAVVPEQRSWTALLAGEPYLELASLRVDTPDGEVQGSARLGIDGTDPEALQNPLVAMSKVSGELDLALPQVLFEDLLEVRTRPQPTAEIAGPETPPADSADSTDPAAPTDATAAAAPEPAGASPEQRAEAERARQELVSQLRGASLIVESEGRVSTRMRFQQGQLQVNGVLVDPLELAALTLPESSGIRFVAPEPTGPAPAPGAAEPLPASMPE